MVAPIGQDTPTLGKVINQAIRYVISNLHTVMPGQIETYDQTTGLATIQPTLRRKYRSESVAVPLPVISDVPVVMPRSGNTIIKTPIGPGDYVLLVFSERAMARWMENGGIVDPLDPAMFSLNDAIAIPGLYPKTEPPKPNAPATSIEISNGTAHVEVAADGTIRMVADNASVEIDQAGNATITAAKITLESTNVNLGDEAGSALAKLSDLSLLTVPGAMGGGPGLPVSAAAAIGTIKTKAT